MQNLENELESVILSLVSSMEKKANERNAELIAKLHEKFKENEELYECEINLAFMHFTNFAAAPWLANNEVKDKKNKCIIEYIYNGLFPHFVRRVIKNNEGSCCSGDKESFIISKVKQAITTGENQSLYATYEGCANIPKEKWNEKAYWSPTSFKDTNEVITAFWNWYDVKESEEKENV